MKIQVYVAAVIVSLLGQSSSALAQGQTANSTENWAAVKAIAVAAEVQIRLKDGKSQKGRYVSADEASLVLSSGKLFRQIARGHVSRVQVIVRTSRGDTAAKGAALGSLLAFAGIKGTCDQSECVPAAAAMLGFGLIGAGMGALIGWMVARPHKRVLIYEVK